MNYSFFKFLSTAATFLTAASISHALSLVDFNAADITGSGTLNSQRSTSEGVGFEYMDLDLTNSTFSYTGAQNIYGGFTVDRATGTTDNVVPAWQVNRDEDVVRLLSNPGNGNTVDVNLVTLFKADEFIDSATQYAFDNTSSLSVNITEWNSNNASVLDAEVRFLVQDSGTFYVSEEAYSNTGNVNRATFSLSLNDFDNNATAGKRWAQVTLNGTDLDIPASLTFSAVDFQDVEAVGFIGEGGNQYLREFAFDTFTATGVNAIPEPATTTLLIAGLGGLLYLRRRNPKA